MEPVLMVYSRWSATSGTSVNGDLVGYSIIATSGTCVNGDLVGYSITSTSGSSVKALSH